MMTRHWLRSTVVLLCLGIGWCQTSQPNTDIFTAVQTVGSTSSGTFRTFYGCTDNGATLQSLTLWANSQYVRGMSASLTDGRQVLFGCVNVTATQTGGCNDTNIRSSNFTFQPGETVSNMTIWPGYDVQGQPNQRAGALNIVTSQGRAFDFGMTSPRIDPVSINLGSGIPCGVAPRAGADIDALGFVFLLPVASSTLQNLFYFGVGSNQGSSLQDVAPLDSNISRFSLSSQIYNNSGKSTGLIATFSSERDIETPLSWSTAPGLDTYLKSNVRGRIPEVQVNLTSNDSGSWVLSQSGVHNRTEEAPVTRSWNYTVTVGAGGSSQADAQAAQGTLTTTFTANLSVVLNSGSNFTFPVMGTYEGESTSPVGVQVTELQAPDATSNESTKSGGSNTLAWVLGVIFGILGGLLFAALIAWAVVLIVRRKSRKSDSSQENKPPGPFFVQGKDKDVNEPSPDKNKPNKDIELGGTEVKGADVNKSGRSFSFWGLKGKKPTTSSNTWGNEPNPKLGTVVGVPADQMNQEGGANAEGSSDRVVVPYVMFRRLRLEAIRNALGLEGQGNTKETGDSTVQKPISPDVEEQLSNPPSGASTPRAVSSHEPIAEKPSNDMTPVNTIEDTKDGKVQDPKSGLEDNETAAKSREARNSRMKDRVAAVMASRKGKGQPEALANQMHDNMAEDPPNQEVPKAQRPKSAKPLTPRRAAADRIHHDDHVINLRGDSRRRREQPEPKPSTPQNSKTVAHDDKQLILGEGYKAAPDARSIQKDTIEMENKRIKLGYKYNTQGRNE